jgi:hypothetical protein
MNRESIHAHGIIGISFLLLPPHVNGQEGSTFDKVNMKPTVTGIG